MLNPYFTCRKCYAKKIVVRTAIHGTYHGTFILCLNRDFCMEKLLAREVTIFPEKNKSCKILLKIYKTNTKL